MPQSPSRPKNCRLWLGIGLVVLGAVPAFLGWQHYYPVQVGIGWSFEVYQENIPSVSAMAIDNRESLYVSQELGKEAGVLFRLKPDGNREEIVSRLSKPDGLALFRDGIAISQEGGQYPVLLWRDGKTVPLFTGDHIEGLASDGQYLYAVEDLKRGGRLLRYDAVKEETTVLRQALEEPEGVTLCPDGNLFYTEKKKGWIKRFLPRGRDKVVVRGLSAPSFLMCNSAGIWITEDLTHGARLLLLDGSGDVHTILSHLRAPQTIISITAARYLVAEKGRGRILKLDHVANAKQ